MNGHELQACARARCEELPGASLEHPFGPEYDVYKVRGKIFVLCTEVRGERIVNVKTRPEDSDELRVAFPDNIRPGYHMNKRHWNTLSPGPALDAGLVADLVTDSYLLVVAGLPRAERPVDPDTFGQASGA